MGGEKSNIFPEGPRALSEGNLPISHLRFDNELQYILVYSDAICTFSGHSERTFRDNDLFLRSMHEHVLRTHFLVLCLRRESRFVSKMVSFQIKG